MAKTDFKNLLKNVPKVSPPQIDVVDTLSRLQKETACDNSNRKIKLSLEFLDTTNPLFTLGKVETEWYADLMNELKLFTQISKKQLFGEYKNKFKPHPYSDITKLNYKDEYLTNPQYEAIQIRLTRSTGRIHGFFVGNTFYIRFLDRWHNMYDSIGYESQQIYGTPMTMAEKLDCELNEKNSYIQELENKIYKNGELLCDNCSDCSKGVFKKFHI